MSAETSSALGTAEHLLQVLGEGAFSATYKYAVILALTDLCVEQSRRDGAAPPMVTTAQLAAKVVELYWPHVRSYRGDRMIRQNSGKEAKILRLIREFRARGRDPSATLARARDADADGWKQLRREVEWVLVQMPLARLQRVGKAVVPFLYEISWDDGVTRKQFSSRDFDNRIQLGQSGEHLVRLAGFVRPLVQREWLRLVGRFNRDVFPEQDLEEFLFGVSRESLAPVRGPLVELQSGRCFYCPGKLREPEVEVDHFVPWARQPDNGLDNLVAAHSRCNAAKRDHLAAADHVSRWAARPRDQEPLLADLARTIGWERSRERSSGIARSVYLHLPETALLWSQGREFVPIDRPRIEQALAAIAG